MRGSFWALFVAVLFASSAVASPEFWRHEWPQTDFEQTSVPNWVEILSGGPPKDGIPALDSPSFVRASGKTGIDILLLLLDNILTNYWLVEISHVQIM